MDLPEGVEADPLILVSNRGPVEYSRDDGERTATPGHGGLVTALSGLAGHLDDAVWVCAALSDEDVVVAREHSGSSFHHDGDDAGMRLRMVELDHEADAFDNGYVPVNARFADAVAEEVEARGGGPR
ncbi:MAG: hypothetical protein ACR2LJ_06610 [Acidimicrobiales bacterium]